MEKEISLQVGGMSCASCVGRVEQALKKGNGVISANVNLATEKAHIIYQDDLIQQNQISQLITQAGYWSTLANIDQSLESEKKLNQDKTHLFICILLTLPLVIPMVFMPFKIDLMPSPLIQFLLATPIQFYFGLRFYKSAWTAIRNLSGNMDLLVALGTSAAYGLSLYEWGKHFAHDQHPHLYFESSSVVITLIMLGKYFEARAKMKTREALQSLEKLKPQVAHIIRNGESKDLPLTKIRLTDLVLVHPSESIPVDGIILEGESSINESLLTGESLPVLKKVNDKVVAGSINGDGVLHLKITHLGSETLLSQIIRLVEAAQNKKPAVQQLVDKISAYFVPAIILIAFLTFVIQNFMLQNWEEALIHAVAVLVIACPCALGLATPTALMVGTGLAARHGILVKDSDTFEITRKISLVVFDKTGTLTEGKPKVQDFIIFTNSSHFVFDLLGSLQEHSQHPLSQATLDFLQDKTTSKLKLEKIKLIPGHGISGIYQGNEYLICSKNLLSQDFPYYPAAEKYVMTRGSAGESVSFLVNLDQKEILCALSFKDEIKKNSIHAINQLKKMGIKTFLLSGDHYQASESISKELGINQFKAEVLPSEKAYVIESLKQKQEIVAMIGDGVNDAPALATAHVGMAMSTGTDVAINSAGLTLMGGDPMLVIKSILISQRTYKKIQQNLFWAFIYNFVGVPLAALGYLSPILAGSAMALSSVSVVTNSLLLKKWKLNFQVKD